MANKNLFNSIEVQRPKRNVFDLTHDVKLSCNMGELVPILALECVPGDKFNIGCESLIRFAPMLAPVMHRISVTMHYFFVPNRILWDGWEDFMTRDTDVPAFPTFDFTTSPNPAFIKMMDRLGIPPNNDLNVDQTATMRVSMLPVAAVYKTWYEFYRDQNLQDLPEIVLIDGDNTGFSNGMWSTQYRAWQHDYFTASLPFAQKGAAVDLPLGAFNDVPVRFAADSGVLGGGSWTVNDIGGTVSVAVPTGSEGDSATSDLWADTSELLPQATTINDLRRAFRLQEFLELNARGGTRYIEMILAHFGVRSSDARLQRPEYITGTKSPVVISEVLNTTGTDDLPQGNMAGHGISVTTGNYGKYFCEEHGYIIGIMSVMPLPAYQQGIPKHFLKYEDRYQYYWSHFAHLGEQPVDIREIYAYHTPAEPELNTFGYVPRYSEYKYMPSRVAGDFRTTLSYWHLGRIFENAPALNDAFIECKPSMRIFAVTDEDVDHLYCHVLNKIRAVRPMPYFGTPSI